MTREHDLTAYLCLLISLTDPDDLERVRQAAQDYIQQNDLVAGLESEIERLMKPKLKLVVNK